MYNRSCVHSQVDFMDKTQEKEKPCRKESSKKIDDYMKKKKRIVRKKPIQQQHYSLYSTQNMGFQSYMNPQHCETDHIDDMQKCLVHQSVYRKSYHTAEDYKRQIINQQRYEQELQRVETDRKTARKIRLMKKFHQRQNSQPKMQKKMLRRKLF